MSSAIDESDGKTDSQGFTQEGGSPDHRNSIVLEGFQNPEYNGVYVITEESQGQPTPMYEKPNTRLSLSFTYSKGAWSLQNHRDIVGILNDRQYSSSSSSVDQKVLLPFEFDPDVFWLEKFCGTQRENKRVKAMAFNFTNHKHLISQPRSKGKKKGALHGDDSEFEAGDEDDDEDGDEDEGDDEEEGVDGAKDKGPSGSVEKNKQKISAQVKDMDSSSFYSVFIANEDKSGRWGTPKYASNDLRKKLQANGQLPSDAYENTFPRNAFPQKSFYENVPFHHKGELRPFQEVLPREQYDIVCNKYPEFFEMLKRLVSTWYWSDKSTKTGKSKKKAGGEEANDSGDCSGKANVVARIFVLMMDPELARFWAKAFAKDTDRVNLDQVTNGNERERLFGELYNKFRDPEYKGNGQDLIDWDTNLTIGGTRVQMTELDFEKPPSDPMLLFDFVSLIKMLRAQMTRLYANWNKSGEHEADNSSVQFGERYVATMYGNDPLTVMAFVLAFQLCGGVMPAWSHKILTKGNFSNGGEIEGERRTRRRSGGSSLDGYSTPASEGGRSSAAESICEALKDISNTCLSSEAKEANVLHVKEKTAYLGEKRKRESNAASINIAIDRQKLIRQIIESLNAAKTLEPSATKDNLIRNLEKNLTDAYASPNSNE
jgi:hypothetical protein